ncbi:hypothetical protein P3710_24620, partial [Vibrio parahaemolyticus]|nr:hypothetical protein [Vibrio parahaemolyticus]
IDQSTRMIRPKHSVLAAIFSLATNAALRGSNALPLNFNLTPETQMPRFKPNSPRVDCPS